MMEAITPFADKLMAQVHHLLFGPFVWIPDATRFYEDNTTLLAVLVALYLPVIFGIKVRFCAGYRLER